MKKKIIKPFDLEKAKNGAKIQTKGGYPVEIFKWDARGNYPIKGMIIQDKEDVGACWNLKGAWMINPGGNYSLVIVEEVEEPKFKIKDWITNGEYTYRIEEVINNCYKYSSNKDSISFEAISATDKNYHLWTIKDAKAGDILVDTEGSIFIFRKICDGYPNVYGGINTENNFESGYISGYWTHKPCFPATKEQRDLLFQKMKEASYEWNVDALKLKKIKPEFWSGDKSNTFGGFFIGTYGDILEVEKLANTVQNYNVFATEKQAKSALAMARISQIMANDIENFGGVVTDEEWENNEWKFVIYRNGCSISTTSIMNDYYFLAFHTEKQRDLFLEKYPQLIKDYLMVDE